MRQSKTGEASDSSKAVILDAAYIKATSQEKNKQKVVICKILFKKIFLWVTVINTAGSDMIMKDKKKIRRMLAFNRN